MNEWCKNRIIELINKQHPSSWNPVNNLNAFYDNIHKSCKAKVHPEVLAAYEAKMLVCKEVEAKTVEDNLNKKIADLELEKQKLQKLKTTV
jgi:predicted DNA-binding protein YlxM (UPF0122 family)